MDRLVVHLAHQDGRTLRKTSGDDDTELTEVVMLAADLMRKRGLTKLVVARE